MRMEPSSSGSFPVSRLLARMMMSPAQSADLALDGAKPVARLARQHLCARAREHKWAPRAKEYNTPARASQLRFVQC